MSSIKLNQIALGTIIRIWHGSRGHDYVFCGIDKDTSEALLLKSNCINNDGSIHKSTTRFHKQIPVSKLGDKKWVVRRVSRIQGERASVDADIIQKFADKVATNVGDFSLPKKKSSYVCSPAQDSRSTIIYT